MIQEEFIDCFIGQSILLPSKNYDFKNDKRLLIPFTTGSGVGFCDNSGKIIVKPRYSMCFGNCYSKDDYIMVSKQFILPKAKGVSHDHIYNSYGIINFRGEVIIPARYRRLLPSLSCNTIFTAQNKQLKYGVINTDRKVIVPFGKYKWIDGFDKGLARFMVEKPLHDDYISYWGLLNEKGEEVLPPIYKYIYNFYGENSTDTEAYNDDWKGKIFFHELNPNFPLNALTKYKKLNKENVLYNKPAYTYNEVLNDYGYNSFDEYSGSYAQYEMGFSDGEIDDAFEGDPDAYWNID